MTVFCRDCRWIDDASSPDPRVPRCTNPRQASQDLVLGLEPLCWDARGDAGLRSMVNPNAVADLNVCGPGGQYFEAAEASAAVGAGEDRSPEVGDRDDRALGTAGPRPVRTLFDRCAVLHASMDALLSECRAIPTVKPTGRGDGERRVVDYRPGR